jgi:DNA mismatch repair protein MutS2
MTQATDLFSRDRASASLPQEDGALPDLLHAIPARSIDPERTKTALALAFAAGGSGGVFGEALSRAQIGPSTWDAAAFADDLFLQNFVGTCFKVRIGANDHIVSTKHLTKLLASPPSDPATVEYRRAIVAELAGAPDLLALLEQLYVSLCRLRGLLEGHSGVGRWDPHRRQLDIMQIFRDAIHQMATGFASARSGLARLAWFGQRVQASEPYQSLCDLLRYDESLATLNVKIGVGADGRIRGFKILSIQENVENTFVNSPWQRWLGKLELFFRGFAFSEGELMARLVYAIFDGLHEEFVPLVQLIGDLEFYLGAFGFCAMAQAAGLAVCLPHLVDPSQPRVMQGLFNPLLLASGAHVVPSDVNIDRHDAIVLITGPNSGGKTRLLQSIALSQLLAQCGLFVPARSASIAPAPGLVVSLIQETKVDQAEGRLGMELLRIRQLFEGLAPGAMVILDELCSGTNPSEGEEIFELVVRMLTRLKPQTFITTHFLEFAGRLERERKIADLRFLQVDLGPNQQPTYKFARGVARTSLAQQTASRLGVTGDQLASVIERNVARARLHRR